MPWFLVACVAKGLTASRSEQRTATAKPAAGVRGELEQSTIRTRNVRFHVKIESGTQVASRGSDMAHCDAAGVNGSNRIITHGAPQPRMMPNGCLGSPGFVLLWS